MSPISPEEPESRKVHRSIVFHGTRWAFFVFCGWGALAASQHFAGDRWAVLRFNVYLLAVLFWGWGSRFATLLCRVLRLSLEETRVERVERKELASSETVHSSEALTIARDKFATFIMPVCTTLLCVICFGPSLFTCALPSRDPVGVSIRVLIFSSTLAVAIFSCANTRKPAVKIDTKGVAFCDSVGLHNQFVKWSRIRSCEVVSTCNVFGKVTQKFLVLKDERNKKLITLRFDSRPRNENNSDLERTAERIKAELLLSPKSTIN